MQKKQVGINNSTMVEVNNLDSAMSQIEENKGYDSNNSSVDLSDEELYGIMELSKAAKSKVSSSGSNNLRRIQSVAPRVNARVNQ